MFDIGIIHPRNFHRERTTSKNCTEFRKNSTMKYFFDRADVVRYVSAQLKNLQRNSALTMTIEREKSGDFCVTAATSLSSGDTEQNTQTGSTGLDVT